MSDLGIKYFSSSSNADFILNQKTNSINFKYKIIKIFNNQYDAIVFESYLHQYFQVSSNDIFINLCCATPSGFYITGNKEVGRKISNTKNTIQSNGLTIAQNSMIKTNRTRKQYVNGKSINQSVGLKTKKTRSIIDPISGLTNYKTAGLKTKKTRSIIDPISGLTNYKTAGLKASITLLKIQDNGQSIAKTRMVKTHKTKSLIQDDGLTIYESSGIKQSITKNIKDVNGLTISDKIGISQQGEMHHRFIGYYVYENIKYANCNELSILLNSSGPTIRKWCKNNKIKISTSAYSQSNFLKSLGNKDLIVGKTFKEIGFNFIKMENI